LGTSTGQTRTESLAQLSTRPDQRRGSNNVSCPYGTPCLYPHLCRPSSRCPLWRGDREGGDGDSGFGGLPAALRRCLATTNLIESPQAGVRQRTHRVTRWKDGGMALRWAATAMGEAERHFYRLISYQQLWMLKLYLDATETNTETNTELAVARRAG